MRARGACTAALLAGMLLSAPAAASAHALAAPRRAGAAQLRKSTVGMPARIEQLVIPGPELIVAPSDIRTPVVLNIVATYPHGDAFRYDLEYWALEPGEFDLADYLRRKASTPGETPVPIPPIVVSIDTLLPPGKVVPHAPADGRVPSIGGYTTLLVVGGVVWVAGLAWMLLTGRRRRRAEQRAVARPATLAERLEPLIERARTGQLSTVDRAQLELGLVTFWRRKLGLEDLRPEAALAQLRTHAQAGPLLASLEQWLHMPPPAPAVDVARLLEPYRDLDAAEIELPAAAGAGRGA